MTRPVDPIRPFVPEDATRCGAIVGATPLWERYALTAEKAAKMLEHAHAAGEPIFVADEGQGAVGFAWMLRRGVFGRSGYLRLIAVDPSLRGRNLGSLLLRAVEREALKTSPDCFLLVSDFNHGAQRFYQREGYVEVGRLDDFVLPGVAELIYRKRLSPAS